VNILFIGDIFGKPGRTVASEFIPRIRQERAIDFCIANGENSAGGFGITENGVSKLFSYGIDVITTGNHVWDRQETAGILYQEPRLLRPANYPPGLPGSGSFVAETAQGVKVGVLNLQGRIFMNPIDCPFRTADRIVAELAQETQIIIIDFHAEASAEKIALSWYLDGRVSAVLGTHTHVMTADERVLPKGTAAITDVGMTGPHDSIIGVRPEQSIKRIMTQVPVRFSPATENLRFNAVVVDVDDTTGLARSIERIEEQKQ
jgi:2',3'-cyclic-nucleotide 2'-phosphodiesterase